MTQTVPDISPLMPMHQDPLLVCIFLEKDSLKGCFGSHWCTSLEKDNLKGFLCPTICTSSEKDNLKVCFGSYHMYIIGKKIISRCVLGRTICTSLEKDNLKGCFGSCHMYILGKGHSQGVFWVSQRSCYTTTFPLAGSNPNTVYYFMSYNIQ